MLQIDGETMLEVAHMGHAEEFFTLIDTDRNYLRQWLPWLDINLCLEHTQSFIATAQRQAATNNGFQAIIRHRGQMVGVIGHHWVDWANGATSIGYFLGERFQGQGLMTKACRMLLDNSFKVLKLNRAEIRCAVENRKSRAIPEGLGFVNEGIKREAEWLYGHFVDHVVYSILAREWDGVKGLN